VAHGGDADIAEPVEGMREPTRDAVAADRGSRLADRPATPAPVKAKQPAPVEPKLADGRGPAHSPEAEDVRAKPKPVVPPAKGKRAPRVYVSPPRDPKAFEEAKKHAAAVAE